MGNAIETSFVLNGVNAANFTAEDEIGAKKVFAEAFDTTPDNIIFVSLHDYVPGEEATLAKAPKKNVEDVKSRAKEAVLRSRSIARHAAALGLAQTTPKLGFVFQRRAEKGAQRKDKRRQQPRLLERVHQESESEERGEFERCRDEPKEHCEFARDSNDVDEILLLDEDVFD